MEKILIIDDEKGILDLLSMVFRKEGLEVGTAINAERALELIENGDYDLVLSDIKLPKMGGMDVLQAVSSSKPEVPVILMTAYGTIAQAVEAMKIGALDYVVKPFDMDELKIIVRQGLEKRRLQSENVRLKKELRQKYEFHNMVGKSQKIQAVFDLIEKIAATDSTVLIAGESGTGKEMAARAIHYLSDRRDQPFISLNCGALPENLLESELFGH
ncbi:MAG: response regulator, partial [Acidobacteria bacterium]|nr:response regulator [Acidobacteriota bacterium]